MGFVIRWNYAFEPVVIKFAVFRFSITGWLAVVPGYAYPDTQISGYPLSSIKHSG
jgi:hypothetical protein